MFTLLKSSKIREKEHCIYIHGWTGLDFSNRSKDRKLVAKVFVNKVLFMKEEYNDDKHVLTMVREAKKTLNKNR